MLLFWSSEGSWGKTKRGRQKTKSLYKASWSLELKQASKDCQKRGPYGRSVSSSQEVRKPGFVLLGLAPGLDSPFHPSGRQAPISSCCIQGSPNRAFSSSVPSPCRFLQTHALESTGLRWLRCQEECHACHTAACHTCDCRLAVDGPFGAALTDVSHYPVSVCIAAGIGVTPFAALLKSIWYRCCESQTQLKLSKVWKKTVSSPFHGLKGSMSLNLSSDDSWGGF